MTGAIVSGERSVGGDPNGLGRLPRLRTDTTSDPEAAGSQDVVAVVAEKESPGSELTRSIVHALIVLVPLMILILVGLVALALRDQSPNWTAYLSMAICVGLLNGVFFGVLAGFVRSGHRFEESRAR